MIFKSVCLLIFFGFYFSGLYSQISVRDTLVEWSHFSYSLNENHSISSFSDEEIEKVQFPGIVMENEYLRLTLIPDFGGRIISCIYKPTGHEQLYQNPNGIPYAINEGTFYYRWLMVYGGIFATFPEPEHGKTWLLPWKSEIVKNNEDSLSISMSIRDTINYPSHDSRFNNGVTGLECTVTISIFKGRSNFSFAVDLTNSSDQSVNYEYWTCNTLAPGSEPGNPFCDENSEIIIPADFVKLKDDWWSWMGQSEIPYQKNDHIFHFNNLAWYKNWDNMGIAYVYPSMVKNYWGVLNHNNKEGILRIADNSEATPGMKLWTWGYEQGLLSDPYDFQNGGVGPYIELWGGHSSEFFNDATLKPEQSRNWEENYIITAGMEDFSAANENGAIYVEYSGNNADGELEFLTKAFSTQPGREYNIEISLENEREVIPLEDDIFISNPQEALDTRITMNPEYIPSGNYLLQATLSDMEGKVLVSSAEEIEIFRTGTGSEGFSKGLSFQLDNSNPGLLRVHTGKPGNFPIQVYSVDGRLVHNGKLNEGTNIIRLNQGFYLVRIGEGRDLQVEKVFVIE